MKRLQMMTATLALGMAVILGAAGIASAYPGGHGYGWGNTGMNQEQQAAAQEIFAEHAKVVSPLHQQMMAKRAELEALSYGKNVDDAKIQSLYREIGDINAKLFKANSDLRAKLEAKGITGGFGGHGGHRGGYGGYGGGCGGPGMGMHRGQGNPGCYGGYGGHW